MQSIERLYRIEGFVDLWVDACLRNDDGQLVFISFYGRDTSVMQFISALELGHKEGGVRRFNLVDSAGGRQMVDVGSVDRLGKHSGRLPRQNIFGPLSQMWLYDKALQQLDRANRIGWIVSLAGDDQADTLETKTWSLVKTLSPVPLLDHWRGHLLAWCRERQAITDLGNDRYPPLGDIRAVRVSLTDHFLKHISTCVRTRELML